MEEQRQRIVPYHWKRAIVIAAIFAVTYVALIASAQKSPWDVDEVPSKLIDDNLAIVDTDRTPYHRLLQSQKKLDVTDRIVGGTTAQANPSYVFTAGTILCGGTLIAPDIVLTAAHCKGAFLAGVEIGGNKVDGTTSTMIAVDSEHPNPLYNSVNGTFNDDVMLVKLKSPSSAPVQTLNFDPNVPPAGSSVTSIGFGNTVEGGTFSNVLLQLQTTVDTFADCNAYYGTINDSKQICTPDPAGGKDTCQGDSGGPLLQNNVQVGIVSFGDGCGRKGVPSVYTRLSGFQQFINDSVCTLSSQPPSSCTKAGSPMAPNATPTVPTAPIAPTSPPATIPTAPLVPTSAPISPTSPTTPTAVAPTASIAPTSPKTPTAVVPTSPSAPTLPTTPTATVPTSPSAPTSGTTPTARVPSTTSSPTSPSTPSPTVSIGKDGAKKKAKSKKAGVAVPKKSKKSDASDTAAASTLSPSALSPMPKKSKKAAAFDTAAASRKPGHKKKRKHKPRIKGLFVQAPITIATPTAPMPTAKNTQTAPTTQSVPTARTAPIPTAASPTAPSSAPTPAVISKGKKKSKNQQSQGATSTPVPSSSSSAQAISPKKGMKKRGDRSRPVYARTGVNGTVTSAPASAPAIASSGSNGDNSLQTSLRSRMDAIWAALTGKKPGQPIDSSGGDQPRIQPLFPHRSHVLTLFKEWYQQYIQKN